MIAHARAAYAACLAALATAGELLRSLVQAWQLQQRSATLL